MKMSKGDRKQIEELKKCSLGAVEKWAVSEVMQESESGAKVLWSRWAVQSLGVQRKECTTEGQWGVGHPFQDPKAVSSYGEEAAADPTQTPFWQTDVSTVCLATIEHRETANPSSKWREVCFEKITHGTFILPDKLVLDLLNESQLHQLDRKSRDGGSTTSLGSLFQCLTTLSLLGKRDRPHLSTTSFQVVVESHKVSPQPPFLQAKQPQFPQPLPISLVLQTLPQLRCPSLDTLQHLNVSLVARGPKLNTGFEVWPHQCRVQGHDHCPSPAGHTIPDTRQNAVCFLGHLGTLPAHIQLAVNPDWRVQKQLQTDNVRGISISAMTQMVVVAPGNQWGGDGEKHPWQEEHRTAALQGSAAIKVICKQLSGQNATSNHSSPRISHQTSDENTKKSEAYEVTDEQDVEANYPNGAAKEWLLLAKGNIFLQRILWVITSILFQLRKRNPPVIQPTKASREKA
ncbi:hypothetical protein QYF61_025162 [Mycteria americana]|uniref:Uncharacterized protein n=1 Tax=Mycteria americana TaxID=33587 RepID=A0AAN7Q8R0_MYCAM|nr:hypothetical protein QYF61_025162 [Mycteria americana]